MLEIHHSGREPSKCDLNDAVEAKRRCVACQQSFDDQTLQLQAGAGKDKVVYLPSGPDHVACKCQEEDSVAAIGRVSLRVWFGKVNHLASAVAVFVMQKRSTALM